MVWTEERTKLLVKLWDEGLTTPTIGARMGITKNAVIGKAHRLKLTRRKSGPLTLEARKARARKRQQLRRQKCRPRLKRVIVRKDLTPILPDEIQVPMTTGVTILARRVDECAYPIGHRIFCGAPVCLYVNKQGKMVPTSWCDHHWTICHIKKGRAA